MYPGSGRNRSQSVPPADRCMRELDGLVSRQVPGEYRSSSCFGFGGEGDATHFEAGADACYFPFDLTCGQDAGGFTRNLVWILHGLLPRFSFCGCTRFCGFDAADPLSVVAGGVFVVLRGE